MAKLLRYLRICMTVATLLLVLALCLQCAAIYMEGNSPENLSDSGVHLSPVFSVETVSAHLKALRLPFLAYAALLLITLCVQAFCPPAKEKTKLPAKYRLHLLKARVTGLTEDAQREEKLRKRIGWLACIALLPCAAMTLVYLGNGEHFVSWDLEQVMGSLIRHVFPYLALTLLILVAASVCLDRSMEREAAALKSAPKAASQPKKEQKPLPLTALRIALYAIAAVLIVLGVLNGGLYDVLVKAINICTECIGLG